MSEQDANEEPVQEQEPEDPRTTINPTLIVENLSNIQRTAGIQYDSWIDLF